MNNIKNILPKEVDAVLLFKKAELSPDLRAENLTVTDFVRLSRVLSSAIIEGQK